MSRILAVARYGIAVAALSAAALSASAAEVAVLDPLQPVYDASVMAKAVDGPLRLSAPRNASASAQVVVTAVDPATVTVTLSDMTSPNGNLPASAFRLRYATKEPGVKFDMPGENKNNWVFNYTDAYCDRLLPSPMAGADVVPVWVTVDVPADATAGLYRGTLKVAGKNVPVEVRVSEWVCPEPAEWAAHVGVVPAPDALAEAYKVALWSPEHWALIERELDFMGMLGANDLWLHVEANGAISNALQMGRFTRKDGKIVPDLSLAEKYVDLFAKHVGQPKYIIVNLWSGQPNPRRRAGTQGTYVHIDGRIERVPRPEDEGGLEVWKPLMEAIRKLATDRGWPEESILAGLAGDRRPMTKAVAALKEIAPFARWAIWTHGRGDKWPQDFAPDEPFTYPNGMEVAYLAHPFTPGIKGAGRPADGETGTKQLSPELQGGWNQQRTILSTARNDLHKYAAPSQWRGLPNGTMLGCEEDGYADSKGSAGFAFLWLDFWHPEGDGHPYESRTFVNKWSGYMTRHNSRSVIEPGPDGPVATVRFEMLREGLQETEARVTIERALAAAKLPAALAEEAKALLTDGFNTRFKDGKFSGGHAGGNVGHPAHMWGVKAYPEWMDVTAALYDMAGKVAAATD